jgi:hypothetical protein
MAALPVEDPIQRPSAKKSANNLEFKPSKKIK